jgi:hypothetical protein
MKKYTFKETAERRVQNAVKALDRVVLLAHRSNWQDATDNDYQEIMNYLQDKFQSVLGELKNGSYTPDEFKLKEGA